MSAQTQEQGQEGREELIDIPATAVVACPLVGFRLSPVERCVGCPSFAGLTDRFPGGGHEFRARYAVGCRARPTDREIKELAT